MQMNGKTNLLTSPFQQPVNQLNYPFLQERTSYPSSSTIHLKMQDYEREGRHSQLLQANVSSSSLFFLNTQAINTLSPNASTRSSETFIDFVEDREPQTAMAEKKQRRMISNRESARRSRMRKKKKTEELQSHVNRLVISNRLLSEKLICLMERNQKILHENSELKEKVLTHQTLLTKFLTSNLERNNMEDVFCITNCLRAEDSTVEQKIK